MFSNIIRRSTQQSFFLQNTNLSAFFSSGLKEKIAAQIPDKSAEIKAITKEHGDKVLGTCTVAQAYGGMRSVKSMVTETSLLDAEEGIRYRGLSIPECQAQLPKAELEPLPEGLIWLLFTGEVPTDAQVKAVSQDLAERSDIPAHVTQMISNFPKTMHPMAQFSAAVAGLSEGSKFAKAYTAGVHKKEYWDYYYEDSMDLIAKLPNVAAQIYRNTYGKGPTPAYNKTLDWGANFAEMLGCSNHATFKDLVRLYLVVHADHEGGNVSAHATHLVGSALSDPYLSLSAGLNGLAGPLHGLANQEVLRWVQACQASFGDKVPTKDDLTKYCWDTLNGGKVIPGYGHAVLRKTDPRYVAQREFALKHLPDDPLFKLVSDLYEVVPKVLLEHGKTANPWPNVDAHSGVLLQYFDCKEENYYTVMFGVARALGVLPSLVWDRALGQPIERPKSVTTPWIKDWLKKQ